MNEVQGAVRVKRRRRKRRTSDGRLFSRQDDSRALNERIIAAHREGKSPEAIAEVENIEVALIRRRMTRMRLIEPKSQSKGLDPTPYRARANDEKWGAAWERAHGSRMYEDVAFPPRRAGA